MKHTGKKQRVYRRQLIVPSLLSFTRNLDDPFNQWQRKRSIMRKLDRACCSFMFCQVFFEKLLLPMVRGKKTRRGFIKLLSCYLRMVFLILFFQRPFPQNCFDHPFPILF